MLTKVIDFYQVKKQIKSLTLEMLESEKELRMSDIMHKMYESNE